MAGYIDAHHHIWRLSDLAWLNGPVQPRIFGNYQSIKRDYSITDFRADLDGSGVEKSVYIQVNWPAGQEREEASWIEKVNQETSWPHALVAYVDFSAEDAAETISSFRSIPIMRGIRQQLHWHKNPLYCFQPAPDLMNQSTWRNNFARIQEYGWSFELQVFATQMSDAARFARDFQDTPMILQHCGMPEDTSPDGMALWADGMQRLAQQPNVYCKFSGLGTFIHRNDPAFIADVTGKCLEWFGAGRCVFGSNYPIEKIWTGYGPIVKAYEDAIAHLDRADKTAIMADNASRLYRL